VERLHRSAEVAEAAALFQALERQEDLEAEVTMRQMLLEPLDREITVGPEEAQVFLLPITLLEAAAVLEV
jgi:hypothetical protein